MYAFFLIQFYLGSKFNPYFSVVDWSVLIKKCELSLLFIVYLLRLLFQTKNILIKLDNSDCLIFLKNPEINKCCHTAEKI